MGDIAVPNLKSEQPDLNMVVCVHKTFVKNTKAYQIPTSKEGYLWSSKGAVNKQNYWSVWVDRTISRFASPATPLLQEMKINPSITRLLFKIKCVIIIISVSVKIKCSFLLIFLFNLLKQMAGKWYTVEI